MYLTPYARVALANFARGEGLTLPAGGWWVGLATGLDSAGIPEEIVDSTYARVNVARSLTAWAGTQGDGTTGVSSGTSHETSNNEVIDFGSISGTWGGTPTHAALYDDDTAGNAWFAVPISAIDLQSGSPASFQPGALRFVFGIVSGTSNYLANKLIDLIFRDEAYNWPGSVYVGYTTTESTNATPGNEPSTGTGYAREAVAGNTAEWGTDGDGTISNVDPVVFNAATLSQGDVVGHVLMDAASGGNMLFHGDMANGPVSVQASEDPPEFPAGALEYYFA
jgi:hypothetical protein